MFDLDDSETSSQMDIDYPSYPEINKILTRCEQMVKGVCFEIIIRRSKTEEKLRYLIDIDPEDIQFVCDVDENMETFEERLNRIENLQGIYIELWSKTKEKIKQCKKEFKNTDYKIVLLKRKSDQIVKNSKSSNPNDRYSAASTIVIGESKSSSESEEEISVGAKRQCKDEYPKISNDSELVMIIGPNGTDIYQSDFDTLNWKDPAACTRKLLTFLFGEKVLATHSLTGNQSPAFRGRERAPKSKLDPIKISDIIYIVTLKCKVSPQIVRAAITTKCADASKKFRRIGMKI
ncbi:early boundary activity protein 2 [Eupeodes corollae]|uniref:early boundary activity protein 2 n=1 Tax=Eupeodes corollae TaxID=290404 RepID=UPI0024917CE8|nr:early boundary activity protein 2 [Eupeodes corollae]